MSFLDWFMGKSMLVVMGVLGTTAIMFAQTPDLTGTWQMDTAKSQVSDGRSVTLVITSAAGKIKLDGKIQSKAGQETTVEFTCAPDGKECEFNEAGHKSKMSMWFSGSSLNVAKTDGPPADVVNEWKLQTSAEGKALTLTVTHIEPSGPDETLVFTKKGS